ncbi:shikimate dehydrogenase [Filomicrobium sp.]|uniref:shikimate dehydrogenase n=1 Tax=Filomicrobium sp. TaxID=2024831 RepID=UPI00258ADAA4|nr:shikimate dehydrogenase [Filomicrobium sp.]MCV0368486.1 shikimate dehydrogenase [Filomicrobium sp.]
MKRACVIGWPIEHSRSPLIHGYWLNKYGVSGEYTKVAVHPDEAAAFLSGLADNGFAGCNVTVPLKEIAYKAADRRLPSADAVGAANTVWLENGQVCAENTDTYGFMTHLAQSAPDWQKGSGPAVILGAGGAARAIVHGLQEAGVDHIVVFNRTAERAKALARDFGSSVEAREWDARVDAPAWARLIVNTTTIGMKGEGDLGLDFKSAAKSCVVADIVYVPLETGLLKTAREHGLTAVDGLGMLLHQAVPGFERWFGVRPEVTDDLRARIIADLVGP